MSDMTTQPGLTQAQINALPGLIERLFQTDKKKRGYNGYVPFNRDGKEAAMMLAKLADALAVARRTLDHMGSLVERMEVAEAEVLRLTAELADLLHDLARVKEHETELVNEVEVMKARYQPSMTDLMTDPATLDAFAEANPLGAKWMPIATAPKDGTRLMAYWPDVISNDSAAQVETWFGPRTMWEDACWQNPFEWGDGHNDPTFWKPLAARPGAPPFPGPTDLDLDRAAMDRPKVQALVEAATWVYETYCDYAHGPVILGMDDVAIALAALPKGDSHE